MYKNAAVKMLMGTTLLLDSVVKSFNVASRCTWLSMNNGTVSVTFRETMSQCIRNLKEWCKRSIFLDQQLTQK